MKTIFSLKRICFSVEGLLIATLLAFSQVSFATPLYYTFEGEVNRIAGYNANSVADAAGLNVGATVSYTLLLDFDAPGSLTYNNGATYTYTDYSGYDYFFADYIAGDALQLDYSNYVEEYNVGLSYNYYNYYDYSSIAVDDYLYFYNYTDISDWEVGTDISAYDYWNTGYYSYYGFINSNMKLTSISKNYNDIPEPGTLLLFSLGLIGLVAGKRANKTL